MSTYAKFVIFIALPGHAASLRAILEKSSQLADNAQGHCKQYIGTVPGSAHHIAVFDHWKSKLHHDQFQNEQQQIDLVTQVMPHLAAEPQRIILDLLEAQQAWDLY